MRTSATGNIRLRTRELLKELPSFCEEFSMGIADRTSVLTRYEYAVDLKLFFPISFRGAGRREKDSCQKTILLKI